MKISDPYPNVTRRIEDESDITISDILPNPTMLAQTKLRNGEPEFDIGTAITRNPQDQIITAEIGQNKNIGPKIFQTIGREQVTSKKLEFSPAWVI